VPKVMGEGRSYLSQAPAWWVAPSPASHAVPGIPSRVFDGAGSQVTVEPPGGIGLDPATVSSRPAHQAVDGIVGNERRDPRLAGEREGSRRGHPERTRQERLGIGAGGAPELRSRVNRNVRRSVLDEGPAALSRSWGRATVSSAATPGMITSAKPTLLAPVNTRVPVQSSPECAWSGRCERES